MVSQPTDAYIRSAKLTVPTKAKAGLWAFKVEPVPNQSFRSLALTFDPALPQAVTLKPEWVFR